MEDIKYHIIFMCFMVFHHSFISLWVQRNCLNFTIYFLITEYEKLQILL